MIFILAIWAVLCFLCLMFFYCASVVSNPPAPVVAGENKATKQWRKNKAAQYARRWK